MDTFSFNDKAKIVEFRFNDTQRSWDLIKRFKNDYYVDLSYRSKDGDDLVLDAEGENLLQDVRLYSYMLDKSAGEIKVEFITHQPLFVDKQADEPSVTPTKLVIGGEELAMVPNRFVPTMGSGENNSK